LKKGKIMGNQIFSGHNFDELSKENAPSISSRLMLRNVPLSKDKEEQAMVESLMMLSGIALKEKRIDDCLAMIDQMASINLDKAKDFFMGEFRNFFHDSPFGWNKALTPRSSCCLSKNQRNKNHVRK